MRDAMLCWNWLGLALADFNFHFVGGLCHVGSLKSAMLGIFTPPELANTPNQDFFFFS